MTEKQKVDDILALRGEIHGLLAASKTAAAKTEGAPVTAEPTPTVDTSVTEAATATNGDGKPALARLRELETDLATSREKPRWSCPAWTRSPWLR